MATGQKLTASTVEDFLTVFKQAKETLMQFEAEEITPTTAHKFAGNIWRVINTHVISDLDALRALVAEKEAKDANN